ncbi:hypothetical protein AAFF_G00228900 [Aldrovandia affinis]|uniref:Uncharacterized protein n=1 Tax=Aldrovandia affinis TaxID=143900 RepID=A0AAD7SVD0_9TELE|nr:hypothetical protein AAFF_G00228900 [Aldrovandia affinis]
MSWPPRLHCPDPDVVGLILFLSASTAGWCSTERKGETDLHLGIDERLWEFKDPSGSEVMIALAPAPSADNG